jgi:hypothetical protein
VSHPYDTGSNPLRKQPQPKAIFVNANHAAAWSRLDPGRSVSCGTPRDQLIDERHLARTNAVEDDT